jgi:hypothetical protein
MMYNTIGELDVEPSNKWEFAKLSLTSKLCCGRTVIYGREHLLLFARKSVD